MRITGGTLASRRISVPGGDLRPTQDKVRAALFSMLATKVPGARVLDLFAGSGALGFEAWSRGASSVCWVEKERRALVTLRENVETLCAGEGGRAEIRPADAFDFLRTAPPEPFDIVLADPPYDREGERGWLGKILPALSSPSMLARNGVFVFEQHADEPAAEAAGWIVLRDRAYGGTRLVLYGRSADYAVEEEPR